MGVVEILIIIGCSAIVAGTVISAIIRKKKGKHSCDCDCNCCGCSSCKNSYAKNKK
ncbi:MAG: hypothetical protein WCR27_09770 [Eubacteriales bacterium]